MHRRTASSGSSIGFGRFAPIDQIEAELQRYFAGEADGFHTPLALNASPFTRTVWQALRAIRAEAEARAAHLDFGGAVDRFKAAQSLPAEQRTDGMELAIVDSRRREVEALLRESVREEK